MSDFSALPPRPSLEQLRKQAKELLNACRAGETAALERVRAVSPHLMGDRPGRELTLGDVQFVRARELGFADWAALGRHVGSLQPSLRTASFDESARDIVAAFHGDAQALERLKERLGFWWDLAEHRRRVLERKRLLFGPGTDESLTIDHARLFLSRHYGFDSWTELLEQFASSGAPAVQSSRGLLFEIDADTHSIRARQPLSAHEWDTLAAVAEERGVTRVEATGQMTDEGLARISRLSGVTSLQIKDSPQLSDEGLLHLAHMPQLEELNAGAWNRRVTDRGLTVLRHLVNLRTCSLFGRQGISDAGIANLTFCDRIEKVDLLGSTTGDGAINALTGKRALYYLLAGSGVTDAGMALLPRFPVFRTWQGGDVEYSLGGFDARPNYLWLNTKAPFTDAGLKHLSILEGAFAISLFGGSQGVFDDSQSALTGRGIEALVDLPHLGWLGCANRSGNNEAMRHIARMPHLRMLSAQDAVAGDEGFIALSRSASIELISGRRCHNLGARGFTALADMPRLSGLSVSCKNVDDSGLAALPRFPVLQELTAIDIPDAGYRHIGRCSSLEVLWAGKDTTDEATSHIAGLPSLRTFGLSTSMTDRSLQVLSGMPSIERLVLGPGRGFTNEGLVHLARLPRLKELTLNNVPNVTRQGLAVLPAAVKVNYSTE